MKKQTKKEKIQEWQDKFNTMMKDWRRTIAGCPECRGGFCPVHKEAQRGIMALITEKETELKCTFAY